MSLFRSLFRGREDVYACLWISKKTGKAGYSPVCKNEWVRQIGKKPIMKCSQCPNREFLPLNDDVIRKHLEGAHVVGIYPMLQDESCYFLAVDFDKEDWVDIGAGFNESRLYTLFITMPISFKGKVVQYAGRLHRSYRGKEEIRIYDYVDKDVPVFLGMYRKKQRLIKR